MTFVLPKYRTVHTDSFHIDYANNLQRFLVSLAYLLFLDGFFLFLLLFWLLLYLIISLGLDFCLLLLFLTAFLL